jgi:stage V sporulation protein SpoVS
MAVQQGNIAQMQISRTTNVKNLAASIAKHIQRGKIVRMIAIGAGAINQMVKASACSLQYLAPVGMEVRWKIFFTDRPIPEDAKRDEIPEEHQRDTWSAIVLESYVV